jgi:predicted PurR-regulated permease PerM
VKAPAAASPSSGRWRFWLGAAIVFAAALWLLNDILLPFVVGMVVAYIFDPLVARLQRLGLSRTLATACVTILAVLLTVGITTAIFPPLLGQIEDFASKVPQYFAQAAMRVQPMIEPFRERFGLPPLGVKELQAHATQWAGEGFALFGTVAGRLAQRGFAIVNLFALLFLTPVVTFYLLRDWPKVMAGIDDVLPLDQADTIRRLAGECNAAIAGYVRGQALVCLCLGTWYGVGLTIVGLQFGFVIGMIAGIISFIPFVGTIVGGTLALGMALAQFPPDWVSVAEVGGVFVVGHLLESNFLSPKLVGDRVGLHPVWIMFALLAGGSLFGFVGVLVAVPIAAIVGVLVRYLFGRYHESAIYRGDDDAV